MRWTDANPERDSQSDCFGLGDNCALGHTVDRAFRYPFDRTLGHTVDRTFGHSLDRAFSDPFDCTFAQPIGDRGSKSHPNADS